MTCNKSDEQCQGERIRRSHFLYLVVDFYQWLYLLKQDEYFKNIFSFNAMKFYNCLIVCKLHNIIIIKNMKEKQFHILNLNGLRLYKKKVKDTEVRITLR